MSQDQERPQRIIVSGAPRWGKSAAIIEYLNRYQEIEQQKANDEMAARDDMIWIDSLPSGPLTMTELRSNLPPADPALAFMNRKERRAAASKRRRK